jgi:hypothetical protein
MPATVRVSLVLRQETGRKTVDRMLPDFRFIIGATLAVVVLAVTSFGLFMAVHVTHQAKVGPLEASRSPVFDDRADWNQFYDPAGARRFEELARKADADVPVQRAAESPPDAVLPQAAQPQAAPIELHADQRNGESAATVPNAPTAVTMAPPVAQPPVAAPAPTEPAAATPIELPSSPSPATPAATPTPIAGAPAPDEPNETGTLPPAAAQAPTAPPAAPDVAKAEETPATPAPPLPVARPAAPPARKKTVARDPDDEDTPVRRAPPKPRVVRPAQQTAPQPFASDQQYWRQQQQNAPQQRQQRQTDPLAQQSGWR